MRLSYSIAFSKSKGKDLIHFFSAPFFAGDKSRSGWHLGLTSARSFRREEVPAPALKSQRTVEKSLSGFNFSKPPRRLIPASSRRYILSTCRAVPDSSCRLSRLKGSAASILTALIRPISPMSGTRFLAVPTSTGLRWLASAGSWPKAGTTAIQHPVIRPSAQA